MIIDKEGRNASFLFITTRRCASFSIYAELGAAGWHRISEGGPSPESHAIPERRMAPLHITVCRNPYARALSCWRWSRGRYGNPTLDAWLEGRLPPPPPKKDDQWMLQPCSAWHDLFLHDVVIPLESFRADFHRLTGVNLPLKIRKHVTSGSRDLTPNQVALVNAWAAEDFRRYNYPMETP